ncbi:MAG: hypothetical protein K2I42_06525 [Anaeroplasmataceae bacterium]|nr:hypothetical protein [Anaeroplasmataceae bacterium]
MKKFKKLFLMTIALLFVVTLASCKNKEVRNTSIPMGNLDTSIAIAASGNHTIQNGLYYTRLRASNYNLVDSKIKEKLFAKEIELVKSRINLSNNIVTDEEEDLFDSYATDIYGTATAKSIKKLTDDEKETAIQKYIDSCSNKGIFITKEDCDESNYSFELRNGVEKIVFKRIPEEIIQNKLLNLAINEATKTELEELVLKEKIEDEDGKLVNNSQFISDDAIRSSYESTLKTYGTYRAIIIQFNNLTEARETIDKVEKTISLTQENALKFYTSLYNTYYNYRPQLTADNPWIVDPNNASKNVFVVDQYKDELSDISSSIKDLVIGTLDEDGAYISEPFNVNNKYVMVYRGQTELSVNKEYNITPYNEQIKWDKLSGTLSEDNLEKVKTVIRDNLIKNRISTYSSTIISERIKDAKIEIYDPYFEYQFKAANGDNYDVIKPSAFNNDKIFSITYTPKGQSTEVTADYSVSDFYADATKETGLINIIELLKYEYVYDIHTKFVEKDDIEDMKKSLNDAVSSFKKNKMAAYPSAIGEATYLLTTTGYTTVEDALKYNKIASSALSSYLTQTVFDEWATEDHKIDTTKLNALENILKAGNDNYSSLFSINIDHMLIYIDDNGDGNPDDPEDFLRNFNETEKNNFYTALNELATAIYNEANCEELTKSNDLMEILEYIVGAYSRNERLYSNKDVTWNKYKSYNFLLRVESLSTNGDTTQSNVGNYVKDFGDYIKALYKKAIDEKLDVKDDEPVFYFLESGEDAPTKKEDLCATEFGFHMIVVNKVDKPSTTKNSASSDSNGYQKDFSLLLNEMDPDTTDDNIYVMVEDLYNENETEATMNQLFTYYVQLQKGITSTFDSTLRDTMSSMFTDAITRYTSSDFQNYLLFDALNITTQNATLEKQLANYKGYLKRTSQSYDKEDKFNTWYEDTVNWTRPYSE